MTIPYDALDISDRIRQRLEDSPSPQVRLALATGTMCTSDKESLGLCVLLAGDSDSLIANAAKRTLTKWDIDRVRNALHRHSHEKILEYIIEFLRVDDRLEEEIFRCISLNPRTAKIIARRASERVCEDISKNRQQLLLNPDLILELQKNAKCPAHVLSSVETFLKLQHALPEEYNSNPEKEKPPSSAPKVKPRLAMNLEAEIEAALSGKQSPSLIRAQGNVDFKMFSLDDDSEDEVEGFSFDFRSDKSDEFSFDLSLDGTKKNDDDDEEEEQRQSLEAMINNMAVGHRIKLAYRGNKEARGILIRDTNRSVAVAVVKSGRMTDGEVANYAGNRNLSDDVIREITSNNEYTRKYPVKVALLNNPKTPVGIALGLINSLQKRDLQNLSRNRNVSSVINTAARKRFKDKFRKT